MGSFTASLWTSAWMSWRVTFCSGGCRVPRNPQSCQGRELSLCWLVSVGLEETQVIIVIVAITGAIITRNIYLVWTVCQTLF